MKIKILTRLKEFFQKRKKLIVILPVVFVLLSFTGWKILTVNKKDAVELQTTQVERGMIISSVSASGSVLSVNVMSANTKASGIVKAVYVQDGDYITKGDKILEIDLDAQGQQKQTQAWASYLSAKNSLESAKTTAYSLQSEMFGKWDTFKELAESDEYEESDGTAKTDQRNLPEFLISQDDWLAAEAKYKNQEAVITQAQVALSSSWLDYQLSSAVITAPTSGVITSLMYTEGMSIGSLDTGTSTSNQKVATIKTTGMPVISVNLSEIDVSKVKVGQKATVVLDSIADKTFSGQVIGVDRIGSSTSGVTQYPAIIRLDSDSVEILPNMTVTANIIIERKDNALLVPSVAVQIQTGQSYVLVLQKNQQQSVLVETGLVSDTQTEIVSGLAEGDLVVTGTSSINTQQDGDSPFGGSGMRMMRMPG